VAARQNAQAGQLRDGLHYAVHHPDILWPTVLAGVFGMFTSNLPVTLAAYARSVFHSGPGGYGLLSAIVVLRCAFSHAGDELLDPLIDRTERVLA
jgi:hypothetical protein